MITTFLISSQQSSVFLLSIILFAISFKVSTATTFTLINKCDHTIWPGTLSSSSTTTLSSTGFELLLGTSHSLFAEPGWSGRFWARTGCNFNPTTNTGTCVTADCGSGQIQCHGGAIPPATLAEFTLNGSDGQDFYDVSLVDGYNLPVMVEVVGGSGSCQSTGCGVDVNQYCPVELKAAGGGACKSACEALGSDEYCCIGEFGSGPDKCKPSVYSEIFKTHCPKAYSYAYDDATSTFTCTGADYKITFCPGNDYSQKSESPPITTESPPTTTYSPPSDHGSNHGVTPVNQVSSGTSTSGSGENRSPMEETGNNDDGSAWISGLFSGDGNSLRIRSRSKLAASIFVIQVAVWL